MNCDHDHPTLYYFEKNIILQCRLSMFRKKTPWAALQFMNYDGFFNKSGLE